MNIGEIGNNFKSTTHIDYLSDRTFIEFDLLIIDTDSLLIGHNPHQKKLYDKRREDLNEFLNFKKTPLVILSPTPKTIGFSNHSNQILQHRLSSILPIPEFETVRQSGQKIIINEKTHFSQLLKKYENHFGYNVVFTEYSGTVTVEVPLTKRVLSFFNDKSVFLPQRVRGFGDKEEEFLTDLFDAVKKISDTRKATLPDWAELYFLPKEKEIRGEIIKTEADIINFQKLLSEKYESVELFGNKKVMFTGTGDELEREVENIFKDIGFEILESDRNRDDLIIKYQDRVAVVEIKGVSGSAAEKQAAQLEKWVANYYDKNEVKAKGILIVNAFKDLKLEERTENPFPDQMVTEYSIPRGHCLITSLQLLGFYYSISDNLTKKDELINTLFDTIGVYNNFNDWSTFINR